MANFTKTQNSFSYGEVSPDFYAHDDISGLSYMENMDVQDGGGLSRRYGLMRVANLTEESRLISFSVSETENYILVMGHNHIWIYSPDGTRLASLNASWTLDMLPRLQYAQRFGTMVFVHPDVAPKVLRKSANGFVLENFVFDRDDSNMNIYMPFMRYDNAQGVSITIAASDLGNNYATLTTNTDFWTADYVGSDVLVDGRQWSIVRYVNPTQVVAYTNGGFSVPEKPIKDWYEAAFSTARGWPCSITFHQDRLVFGGARSYPAGIWMSKVGQHKNFDVGTGLDDEAIFLTLLSQQRQQICTIVSGDNLQILTSVGEWAISNKPLTPSSVDIKQHTSVGSCFEFYLPPQRIEGTTVFVSNNLQDIRELALDELGETYNATDLCVFSKHLMKSPIDIAYNATQHKLYVVMSDGSMAVLNKNSSLGINAWGRYTTYGNFQSVCVVNDTTYVIVRRDESFFLEKFSKDSAKDAEMHDFAWRASALPLRVSGHNAKRIRIRKITARVWDTKSIFINGTRVQLPNDIYSDSVPGFSGDVSVNILGTSDDINTPVWTIHGNEAYPVSILSVNITGSYSV